MTLKVGGESKIKMLGVGSKVEIECRQIYRGTWNKSDEKKIGKGKRCKWGKLSGW